ncbi:MAG: site-specific integrase [Actinomycetales bacterium]|nr:site-specific integrase [Actinomycetales bacterium]
MAQRKAERRGFGYIRRLPSKRYQASYIGPDTARHSAPHTFEAKGDAEAWLAEERRACESPQWVAPKDRAALAEARRPVTVGEYAESWIVRRDLRPRTRAHYRSMLDRFILPRFADRPLAAVTPREVAEWHHALAQQTGPTYRAHAYSLLRTLYRAAIAEDEAATSPCRVPGAGQSKRVRKIEPATLAELEALTKAMPERLRAMVLLMAWCALRFGEATELRRKDVDLTNGVLHVRRGVVRVDGERIVGETKTEAGRRDVAVPPHLIPVLRDHLATHAAWGRDGLLFPARDGGNLPHSTFLDHFHDAASAAGRPDLTPHMLRHTGAVLAAQTGATLAELMARLGHTTPAAAMRYQHAAQGRDAQIAAALSAMVEGAK